MMRNLVEKLGKLIQKANGMEILLKIQGRRWWLGEEPSITSALML
jgi:hypothetical protein